ncbi:hypothetical protein [Bradyrhizobium sp. USDA 4454]
MKKKRNRFKQTTSLQERLGSFAKQAREKARRTPPGKEREDFLRRARSAYTAAHIEKWLSSPSSEIDLGTAPFRRRWSIGMGNMKNPCGKRTPRQIEKLR